jgi:hypothetical protein
MAEALAVVGVVSSIIQLADFSSKILHRLDEFQSSRGEIPKIYRHIKSELPILREILEQTKEAIDAGLIRDETKRALLPAVEGCREQIASMDAFITKALPASEDSKWKKVGKAMLSVRQDAKVESITKAVRSYIGTLTFYYAAASSTLRPLTGIAFLKLWMISLLIPSLRWKAS